MAWPSTWALFLCSVDLLTLSNPSSIQLLHRGCRPLPEKIHDGEAAVCSIIAVSTISSSLRASCSHDSQIRVFYSKCVSVPLNYNFLLHSFEYIFSKSYAISSYVSYIMMCQFFVHIKIGFALLSCFLLKIVDIIWLLIITYRTMADKHICQERFAPRCFSIRKEENK